MISTWPRQIADRRAQGGWPPCEAPPQHARPSRSRLVRRAPEWHLWARTITVVEWSAYPSDSLTNWLPISMRRRLGAAHLWPRWFVRGLRGPAVAKAVRAARSGSCLDQVRVTANVLQTWHQRNTFRI